MPYFYVNTNAQSNGDHEVHQKDSGCEHQPDMANRKTLGLHANCRGAVTEARNTYPQSNGCYYCCNACHTR